MFEPTEWDCDNCGEHNITQPDEPTPICAGCEMEEDWDYILGTEFDDDLDYFGYDGYGDEYLIDGVGFADPGGRSALRAATRDNPRDRPCPTCGAEDVLTRIDVQRGYQCDRCADMAEGRIANAYY